MKTPLILAIFCAILLNSCKNQQTEYHRKNSTCNIDLSKIGTPSISDYFSKIELIPLETSDSSLIKIISGLTYNGKSLYLLDKQQKQVLVFDIKGNYKYKIEKRGNGPGEYSDLSAFQINRFSGDFELLVPMGGILKYDSLGQTFKGKIPLPLTVPAAHDFIALDNNTYLFFCNSREGNKMVVYNAQQNKIISEMYDLPEFLFFNTLYHHSYSPFYVYNNKVHFTQSYNGDVFTLENNSLVPKYRWDFGEKNFDISNLEDKPIEYYMKYSRTIGSKYANTFITYGENSKYYLTTFFFNNKIFSLIYDKKSGKSSIFNSFKEGHKCMPCYVDEEAIYYFADASHINIHINRETLDDTNKKIYDSITNDDNPIIIKYKFK